MNGKLIAVSVGSVLLLGAVALRMSGAAPAQASAGDAKTAEQVRAWTAQYV